MTKEITKKTILRKIKERKLEDDKNRKLSEKFVEDFIKEHGPIKYFPDQWRNTKVWKDAYEQGYQQAQWESEDDHKDMIYKLVKQFTVVKNL